MADEHPLLDERHRFYEDLYFFELERKDRIGAGMAIPLALIFALVGVFLFFVRQWPAGSWGVAKYLLAALVAAGAVFLTLAIAHFRCALFGATYGAVNTPAVLEKYRAQLLAAHASDAVAVDRDFEEEVRRQIVETTSANFATNNRRVRDRLHAYRWMLWSAVAFAFAMVALRAAVAG